MQKQASSHALQSGDGAIDYHLLARVGGSSIGFDG
jgi:uncharacterized protein (DUF2342 family)